MKKYIVDVRYKNSENLVYLVKARNDKELETFMNNWVKTILNEIYGYEYEELKRSKISSYKWQTKNECPVFALCGTYIGVEWIKEKLKKE